MHGQGGLSCWRQRFLGDADAAAFGDGFAVFLHHHRAVNIFALATAEHAACKAVYRDQTVPAPCQFRPRPSRHPGVLADLEADAHAVDVEEQPFSRFIELSKRVFLFCT